jgi:hypothetical protein
MMIFWNRHSSLEDTLLTAVRLSGLVFGSDPGSDLVQTFAVESLVQRLNQLTFENNYVKKS